MRPLKVAFHLIGGRQWYGGRNYLRNLLSTLTLFSGNECAPCLFVGTDVSTADLSEFEDIKGCQIVRSTHFNVRRNAVNTLAALLRGKANRIEDIFADNDISVAFENARYYGKSFGIPTISWLPDFQHRQLRQHFSRFQYWRREIGFRAQTSGNRQIMVSSEEGKRDCERYFPKSKGAVHAVPFAVHYMGPMAPHSTRELREKYDLPERYYFLPNQFYVHKNHILVAQALSIAHARGKSITVVATGNTKDVRGVKVHQQLRDYLVQHKLEESFRILGIVPYKDVRTLMNGAQALLNPSLFEGWSTTVEEAKADGVPLILSDIGVHKEQAPNALFFDRSSPESLACILADDQLLTEMRPRDPVELARLASERLRSFSKAFVQVVRVTLAKRPPQP